MMVEFIVPVRSRLVRQPLNTPVGSNVVRYLTVDCLAQRLTVHRESRREVPGTNLVDPPAAVLEIHLLSV